MATFCAYVKKLTTYRKSKSLLLVRKLPKMFQPRALTQFRKEQFRKEKEVKDSEATYEKSGTILAEPLPPSELRPSDPVIPVQDRQPVKMSAVLIAGVSEVPVGDFFFPYRLEMKREAAPPIPMALTVLDMVQ